MAPSLAFIGATGHVGAYIAKDFAAARARGALSALKLLTTRPESLSADAEVVRVSSYTDRESLVAALRGVDILVSAMGTQGDYHAAKAALIDAAVDAGIKVYVPSEMGTDWRSTDAMRFGAPMFRPKEKHLDAAQKKGLKVLAFYNAHFLELSFEDWLGLDISKPDVTWTLPGGEDTVVAFTSVHDIGRFILAGALQAYEDPDSVPTHLRVASETRTLGEAADVYERVKGGKVTRVHVTAQELERQCAQDESKDGWLSISTMRYMMATGVFDHSRDCANDQLLHGEHTRTFDDFFSEGTGVCERADSEGE